MYPLQTCYNICEIVALVVTAICRLCPTVFCIVTSIQTFRRPYMFLQEPSKYNKYLRLCLISWFSEENINIDYVVPNINAIDNMNEVSDSDEDEEIERLDDTFVKSIEKKKSSQNPVQKEKVKPVKNINTGVSCFPYGNGNCKSTFTRRSDLKRHILKFHGSENIMAVQTGKCLCIQCGQQFHRVIDFRNHLTTNHDMEFRTETLDFDNKAGKLFI